MALAGLILCGSAAAQVEEGGLDFVDPFGVGYLEAGEPAMPTNMWKASRTEDLLPLIREVRTRALTPAERMLLRRVVLSPAARPEGEAAGEVLAERARILYELGEADAAADLLGRLETNPPGLNAEELSVDLQLALGNHATACQALAEPGRTGPFWVKLRAVCAVLNEESSAAELAVELLASQGVEDDWFADAVFAASLDDPGEVPARFDSGLNLTLSSEAGLQPPDDAITASRPDLAAAIARRDTLALNVRVPAAGVAAEAGLMDADAHRALYAELVSQDEYQPVSAIGVAVLALQNDTSEPLEKARKLAMALTASGGNPARFAAAARLFAADLETVEMTPETARYAPVFARAALAAGDLEAAAGWLESAAMEGAPEPDPFELAFLDALLILAGAERPADDVRRVGERLSAEAETEAQQARAARLFALWTARSIPPPAAARALMAGIERENGARETPWRMLAVRAAAEADAAGEVVVATLSLTQGDPTRIAAGDTLALLDALAQIDAGDAAALLALEATGYWKIAR